MNEIPVLHLLVSLGVGGKEKLILDLARHSAQNRSNLSLIAFAGGPLEEEFQASGIRFIIMPRRAPVDPWLVAKIRKFIRAKGIKIVHAHEPVEAWHAYLASRGLDVKTVLTVHGHPYDWKNNYSYKKLLCNMDADVVVSEAFRLYLVQQKKYRLARRTVVIHNGIDPRRLGTPNSDIRKELRINETACIGVMVANFLRGKDHMSVCRAVEKVLPEQENFHFLFVGGPQSDRPEQLSECQEFCRVRGLSERIHFLGNRIDVGAILKRSNVFVMSSIDDTFGIAVVEAMMMGIPTLINDIPVFREISDNGRVSRLYRSQNPASLATGLRDLLKDAKTRTELSNSARAWAYDNFTIEKHAARLQELYEELAECAE